MRIIEQDSASEILVFVASVRNRATRVYIERVGKPVKRQAGWRSLTRTQYESRPGVHAHAGHKPFCEKATSHCIECGKGMPAAEAADNLVCRKCRRKGPSMPIRDLNRQGTDVRGRHARSSATLSGAPNELLSMVDDEGEHQE